MPGYPDRNTSVVIDYTNHRGERRERRVKPLYWAFSFNEWHPEPQWLMVAVDLDNQQTRHFALSSIHVWKPLRREGGEG